MEIEIGRRDKLREGRWQSTFFATAMVTALH